MLGSSSLNPVRSCLGCGRRAPQNELLRVFLAEGAVVDADPDRKRGGRGAYLCWKVECLWEARKRNRFSRALRRVGGPVEDAGLSTRIAERLRERILRRLHTARRAGAALPYPGVEARFDDVRAIVLGEGATVPEGLGGVALIAGGPAELLALALQAPQATMALVLDGALARELAGVQAVREDFLRTPPTKPAPRPARAREANGKGGEPGGSGEGGGQARGGGAGPGPRRAAYAA